VSIPAIAGEEPAADTEPLEGVVEVGEGGLREARHRVPVQGQQRQRADPGKRRLGDGSQQVEAQVQYLEGKEY
jgi:hypothetical protein